MKEMFIDISPTTEKMVVSNGVKHAIGIKIINFNLDRINNRVTLILEDQSELHIVAPFPKKDKISVDLKKGLIYP
ncbi:hypothetical protein [Aquimarina pacifica]|uniref:hypothetical protein n=1 Tax=Aquimarina pacifica TaxID=1296415 RepID=UPI00047094C6|nr:hypothetical protein [Aquimarina pacifica]